METLILITPVVLSFFILVAPSGIRFIYALGVTLLIAGITSVPALGALLNPGEPALVLQAGGPLGSISFSLDSLSAFFILVVNFTSITGMLYSNGYLRPYVSIKSKAQLALHYFCYTWLHLSMLAVLVLRDGTAFLIAWELMAVSSFMLILFEAEKRTTLKTAVNYLIQMHVGLVLLIIAFLIVEAGTSQFGFNGLQEYFSTHPNLPLFCLFFAGFAVKAGFVPFHTWLPEAHPAAPSHVSGVMSGVMIKMGIYGIVRILTTLQTDLYIIGILVTIVGTFTGLYGIMHAVVQTDLKKLLAYSTIENAGIIGIGLGIGAIGLGLNNPAITLLGFGGGLFHVLNHSLFKSLLFYGAGSVYKATHTRNIDKLGGLIHTMPGTAGLFLFGTVAICALPPLNGFLSELLIYYGLFTGLQSASVFQTLSMMMVILALALIGGLAIFGFSKAFGITFLGNPRSEILVEPGTIGKDMLFPKWLIVLVILLIGFVPLVFLEPIMAMIGAQFHVNQEVVYLPLVEPLTKISMVGAVLFLVIILIIWMRSAMKIPQKTMYGPTWGCGYTAGTPRQQYTASSFDANFTELANPVLQSRDDYRPVHPEALFPGPKTFKRNTSDVFTRGIGFITFYSMLALKKIARLQTGNIQNYILYAFIFMLIIFALLYMNLI